MAVLFWPSSFAFVQFLARWFPPLLPHLQQSFSLIPPQFHPIRFHTIRFGSFRFRTLLINCRSVPLHFLSEGSGVQFSFSLSPCSNKNSYYCLLILLHSVIIRCLFRSNPYWSAPIFFKWSGDGFSHFSSHIRGVPVALCRFIFNAAWPKSVTQHSSDKPLSCHFMSDGTSLSPCPLPP